MMAIIAVLMLASSVWMWFDKECANFKSIAVLCMLYSLLLFYVGVRG